MVVFIGSQFSWDFRNSLVHRNSSDLRVPWRAALGSSVSCSRVSGTFLSRVSTVTFLPNFLLHFQQLCLEPPSLLATASSRVSVLLVCIHCCNLQLSVPHQMASSFCCSGFGTHRLGPDTQSSEMRPENNPLPAVLPSSRQVRGTGWGSEHRP